MKRIIAAISFLLLPLYFSLLFAQKNKPVPPREQCATMAHLEDILKHDPALKARFNQQLQMFNKTVALKSTKQLGVDSIATVNGNTYTIPIVFHIVATNPNIVTDAQILAQLDVLNKDFSGTNEDAASLPAYFKPLFGKSGIQFCLAQRTPDGENTNGIDRFRTTKKSFSNDKDSVKHAALGGVDIWDGTKYFNVWICTLSNGLLGYGTFPNDGAPLGQGVVIDYRTLPGGSFKNYNEGKTLTHESGHYFNLYHIWGDDGGACTGTDYVDDTPNQGNSTSNCPSGLKTDNCTTDGNGILYQDYMDYSFDPCLLLFTNGQVVRMESALLTYRSSLTVSNACTPIVLKALDAQLKTIDAPVKRICTNSFSPIVTIRNKGSQTLTSLMINTVIDNGAPVNYTWTGSIVSLTNTSVTLAALTITPGIHTIQIFVSAPNAANDENNKNDTLTTTVQYYDAVETITEGFEGNIFPPQAWDIVNPDDGITWQKATGIAKTGNASVVINNVNNFNIGEQDYLRLPELNLVNIDSAYLNFQLAASTFTPTSTADNNWDTLEVLISQDCGVTYASIYKKWGATLVTTASENTDPFIPKASEWRKDSVNLTGFINAGKVMLAFKNTTGNENNVYLDDINIRTQIINPNLKAAGFLVTPNPARNNIKVQFYPNPVNLKSIQLYNLVGQKLAETEIGSGGGNVAYDFDVRRYPAGIYFVRVVFANKILIKKVIKQ